MALYKCGGGGALSETVLWTNPSPTSNLGAVDITLSEDYSNYDYVKVYWQISKTIQTESSQLIKTNDFAAFGVAGNQPMGGCGAFTNASFNRAIYPKSGTVIHFSHAYKQSATTYDDGIVIITKISGLK